MTIQQKYAKLKIMKDENNINAREHHLYIEADPYRMKLISEAIREKMEKHMLEDDTTLSDFCYNMETSYQSYNNLSEDDWDFTKEDGKNLDSNLTEVEAKVIIQNIKSAIKKSE